MAEVVGIVGSALGIVNFTGQVLQGCRNVRNFLDSINDASDDLRIFRTEVKMFLSLLESFRVILSQVDWSANAERWDLARLALDYSDEAVTELQALVNEYESRKPGRWSDIRLVMRREKFEKHIRRIEKVKGYILASRTNLSFIQELKMSGFHRDTEETMRAVSGLKAGVSATANIVCSIPNQLQGISDTILETRGAIETMASSISEEFAHLPASVNKLLEGTLKRVIQDLHGQELIDVHCAGSYKVPRSCFSPSDLTGRQELLPSNRNSTQKVLKQKGRLLIQTWFGVVSFQYTWVKAQETVHRHGLKIRLGAAKTLRVRIEVTITPCLLRIGFFYSMNWSKIPENGSGLEMKLRVYNSVNETSPIVQACRDGNLDLVQQLFTAKKASPFDRLQGKDSLLDVILQAMVLLPMRQETGFALRKLETLYLLFKMIISHGLDPGQIWSHNNNSLYKSPLPFLTSFCYYTPPQLLPILLNTTRTILEHSVQDPFSTADFTEMLRFGQSAKKWTPLPVTQYIMQQEHWEPNWEIKEKLTPFRRGERPEDLGPCDAACFRTWLQNGAEHHEVLLAVRHAFYNLSKVVGLGGMPDEIADRLYYQHLVVCVEFGIDFQDERDGPSILSLFREKDKLYQIRVALRYFNWNEDDITELFEGDLVRSLVFQLQYLEHRDYNGRNLPVELAFKSILASDWKKYLTTAGSIALGRKIPRSVTDSQACHMEFATMSGATHYRIYFENQLAWIGKARLNILANFPFILVAVAIAAFVSFPASLKINVL